MDLLIKQANEKELEEKIFPFWLAHYTAMQITGREVVPYEKLLNSIKQNSEPSINSTRTADEIQADFAPIIESYRMKEAGAHG